MAVIRKNTTAAVATASDSWKADGFINLFLPRKDGGIRKLGFIALKKSNPEEAKLLAWLEEDPSRIKIVLEKMSATYHSSTPDEGSGFDL